MGKAILKVVKNGILLDISTLSSYPNSLHSQWKSTQLGKGKCLAQISSLLESVILQQLGKVWGWIMKSVSLISSIFTLLISPSELQNPGFFMDSREKDIFAS